MLNKIAKFAATLSTQCASYLIHVCIGSCVKNVTMCLSIWGAIQKEATVHSMTAECAPEMSRRIRTHLRCFSAAPAYSYTV